MGAPQPSEPPQEIAYLKSRVKKRIPWDLRLLWFSPRLCSFVLGPQIQVFFQALKMSSKSYSKFVGGHRFLGPSLCFYITVLLPFPLPFHHTTLFFGFFSNFHFSLVFRKADRVPEKVLAHWKQGHRHYVFRGSKNVTARQNQIWEAGYPNLLLYLLRCWGGAVFSQNSTSPFTRDLTPLFMKQWILFSLETRICNFLQSCFPPWGKGVTLDATSKSPLESFPKDGDWEKKNAQSMVKQVSKPHDKSWN